MNYSEPNSSYQDSEAPPLYSEGQYPVEYYDVAPAASNRSVIPCVEDSLIALAAAYASLMNCLEAVCKAQIEYTDEEVSLKAKRAGILANTEPKSLGANAEVREAAVLDMTKREADSLRSKLKTLMALKTDEEIARIKCRLADQTFAHVQLAHQDKELQEFTPKGE